MILNTHQNCAETINNKEKQKELKYMNWLPQSPNLNPIELLWDELDRNVWKMRSMNQTNQNQLWEFLQIPWTEISDFEKIDRKNAKNMYSCFTG